MADIANLKYQLETVTTSLAADPQNTELQNLQRDLGELIRLTEAAAVSLNEVTSHLTLYAHTHTVLKVVGIDTDPQNPLKNKGSIS